MALDMHGITLQLPDAGALAIGASLAVAFYIVWILSPTTSPFPVVNGKKRFELSYSKARKRFATDARRLLKEAVAPVCSILTENGYGLVFHSKYAKEISRHDGLSGSAFTDQDFYTGSMGRITEPLSREAADALQRRFTNNEEWHNISLKEAILQIIAQMSSRVFLGEEICRDPDWLQITVQYTLNSVLAATALRIWPKWLCPVIRTEPQRAREIILPVIEGRRKAKAAAIRLNQAPPRYLDALEWMEEKAHGRPYDPAVARMGLSLTAIHTSSDMLTQLIYYIAGCTDLIRELREEAIGALMDSVMKETQRLKHLHVGTLFVSGECMWDADVYENPDEFDPYRFLNQRSIPGQETAAQFVVPTRTHLASGLGKQACPGWFFAANEIKMCRMWLDANPFASIAVQRRLDDGGVW
ncbi:cytochrome P450 [Aspergillus californicus]